MSMEMKLEWVTPEWAEDILQNHNPTNRRKSPDWSSTLAKYMDEGKFITTHQGIAFNCDGTLKDGQNRLAAVIKHGKPVQMWVAYGVPNEAMDWIDTHRVRNDFDNLVIHGIDVSSRVVPVAKAMKFDYASVKRSERDAFRKFVVAHQEAIKFSLELGSNFPLRLACIRAVIARAWYSCDHDRLSLFGRILNGEMANVKGNRAAFVFRNHMINNGVKYGARGNKDIYEKCQGALVHFMNEETIQKSCGMEGVLFRIPGDPE